jgi:anti-sigma B factor antagonist
MKISGGDITVRLSRLSDKEHVEMGDVVGLQISTREAGHVTILDLRGRATLDNSESELLGNQLRTLVSNHVRNLLLNLADLTQINSSGVSIIVETYVSLKRQGVDLKLLCPGGRVLEVLTVFRLLEVIVSFEDEAQALASFRPLGYSAKA